jgi:acyl-CoA reductase-like NAD-dependent aldehyde dehydrogenase
MPIHFPALRLGQPYKSLDLVELTPLQSDEVIAQVSQVNAGIIKRDLRKIHEAQDSLAKYKTDELIAMCASAGKIFTTETLPVGDGGETQSPEEYIKALSSTTGLPHTLCRFNIGKIEHVLGNLELILKGLTRGLPTTIFDDNIITVQGIDVCYYPAANSIGTVLPSNAPSVNSLWAPAIAMKVPVVLKPGREDPWTPFRLIQAFIKAGLPAEAFGYYPTTHEGADTILNTCSRGIAFGGDDTVKKYESNPNISCHGTGRSKVLIGEDMVDQWPELVDALVTSLSANSGRSCICASTIITPRHGDEIAKAVAEKLAEIQPLAPDDDNARLSGFANPAMADWIDGKIEEGLKEGGVTDISAPLRSGAPRKVQQFGQNFLHPTIVRCDSIDHPLAKTEFLFPYASVVEMPQAEMLANIGPSLVVSAFTKDQSWINQLLRSQDIDRLNTGVMPTCQVQWEQPHEGNLFEFLYHRRAIQRAS